MSTAIPCSYYARGACTKGARCTFSHDSQARAQPPSEVCMFFLQGKCKFADKCIKSHDRPRNPKSAFSSRQTSRGGSPARSGTDKSVTKSSSQRSSARQSPAPDIPTSSSSLATLVGDEPEVYKPTASRTVCNGFAMLGGCMVPAQCQLVHRLSESLFSLMASNAEPHLSPLCHTYFSLGSCSIAGCTLRHRATQPEYHRLLQAAAQPMQQLPTPPPTAPILEPSPSLPSVIPEACLFFFSSKGCSKGQDCRFRHTHLPGDPFPSAPAPVPVPVEQPRIERGGGDYTRKQCNFYAQGNCRRGDSCTYLHEDAGGGWGQGASRGRRDDHRTRENNGGGGGRGGGEEHDPWNDPVQDTPAENGDSGGGWADDDGWGEQYVPNLDAQYWGAAESTADDWGLPETKPEPEPKPTQEQEQDDFGDWHQPRAEENNNENGSGKTDGDTGGWGDDGGWNDAPARPVKTKICRAYERNGICPEDVYCPFIHQAKDEGTAPSAEGNATDPREPNALEGRKFGEVFNCYILYGPGAIPERITTSFDSSTLIISNLSHAAAASIDALVRPYGEPTDRITTIASESGWTARIPFEDPRVAARAAVGLSGVTFHNQTLLASVDASQLQVPCADVPTNPALSRTVMLSWPAPSQVIWLLFATVREAKDQTATLHESLVLGRKIKAEFQRPDKGQTRGFAVKLSNVPASADHRAIAGASGCTIHNPCKPSYDWGDTPSPLERILADLGTHGEVVRWDVVPPDPAKARVTAFATFTRASGAEGAERGMHGVECDFLGGKMNVKNQYYVMYPVVCDVYRAVEGEVEALMEGSAPDPHVRVLDVQVRGGEDDDGGESRTETRKVVRMASKDRGAFARLKIQLDILLRGELFRDAKGKYVWHEYFNLESSRKSLEKLSEKHGVYIEVDYLNLGLRIYGSAARRAEAKGSILKMLSAVEALQTRIEVPRRTMRALLADEHGLEGLWPDGKKIELDVTTRRLTVRLAEQDLAVVKAKLDVMAVPDQHEEEDVAKGTATEEGDSQSWCGLCDLPLLGEPFTLQCGHIYDRACLGRLIKDAIRLDFSGLRCVAAVQEGEEEGCECECGTLIPNDGLPHFLDDVQQDRLLESSFVSHLSSAATTAKAVTDGLHLCPVPHCPMVYRANPKADEEVEGTGGHVEGTAIQCPCGTWICTACCVEHHEGMGCVEYQAFLREGGEAVVASEPERAEEGEVEVGGDVVREGDRAGGGGEDVETGSGEEHVLEAQTGEEQVLDAAVGEQTELEVGEQGYTDEVSAQHEGLIEGDAEGQVEVEEMALEAPGEPVVEVGETEHEFEQSNTEGKLQTDGGDGDLAVGTVNSVT